MRLSLHTIAVAGLSCLPAWGIVIQDVNSPGYVTSNGDYSGVVKITSGQYLCSGALISPFYVLTAGHCVNGLTSWTVNFQTASGASAYTTGAAYLNPYFGPSAYPGLFMWDTAVLQLSAAAPSDATVYGIETGLNGITRGSTLLDMVGYGLGGGTANGVGTSVWGSGTRRHAENWLMPAQDSLNTGVYYTQQGVRICDGPDCYLLTDNPLMMDLSFTTAAAGMGIINGGDSGGPLLYCGSGTCRILGVTDFADLPRSGTYLTDYTYTAGFQNLTEAKNYEFIQGALAPEPGVWLLAAGGLAALCALKRRSARKPL